MGVYVQFLSFLKNKFRMFLKCTLVQDKYPLSLGVSSNVIDLGILNKSVPVAEG